MSNQSDTKVAPIPLAIPTVGEREAEFLLECIRTNFVSTVGPFVDRFEAAVAERHGAVAGVATGAGTQALHAGLIVLGVKPDDLVICPDFTFIASANAIAHQFAKPWLFDIDPATWTLDCEQVERALQEETEQRDGVVHHRATGRRVAAMLPVYTLGTVANMNRLQTVAAQYGIPILADAAAAIGVTLDGAPIADLAQLTAFSFNGNKTITSGGGGMLIGTDEALIKRAKHITTTARVPPDYDHDEVGYNYRMTNVQAAIGCAQLERLDEFIAAKRRIRKRYDEELAGIGAIEAFPSPKRNESTYWFSGFSVARDCPKTAAQIIGELNEAGIGARIFWKPMHMQKPYRDAPKQPTPVSDDLWSRIVTLPCSTTLSDDEQARVIGEVRRILG